MPAAGGARRIRGRANPNHPERADMFAQVAQGREQYPRCERRYPGRAIFGSTGLDHQSLRRAHTLAHGLVVL